ncbi:hypothetical protein L1S32_09500 [Methanogenium sp. S4BF]|uniref:hypothetical protein n=1 Tax=Methanogenium sp. S4BF TaxID=1789226 RepID=UPI002415E615|nr:hypothetical protein [Methanogenium sp. S4BF]WFN34076.1 hypothetical protein L1S32_09500 [Methanogenium sp. S4BF]
MDITKSAITISLANCFTSIFAGIALFTTLGFLAHQSGVAVSEVVSSGIRLAFVVYPAAIAQFPVFPQVLGKLFFVMLITLGVDSAFSLTEAVSTTIFDEKPHLNRSVTIAALCGILFLIGILFTTGRGLYWLDIIDHYINTFMLLITGILETVVIGWIFGAEKLRDHLNSLSAWKIGTWYDLCIKFIVPLVLGVLLVLNVISEITEPYGGYDPLALGIGFTLVVIAGTAASFIIARVLQAKRPEGETP